jgi:hypothetical protein
LSRRHSLDRQLAPQSVLNHTLVREKYNVNFKKTAFGLAAAAALSLSLSGGVMAQTDANAELNPGAGTCGVVVAEGTGTFDLGTWTYDYNDGAPQYVGGGDTATELSIVVTQEFQPSVDCAVSVSVGNLGLDGTGTTVGTDAIASSNINVSFGAVSGALAPYTAPFNVTTPAGTTGTEYFVEAELATVPGTTTVGSYSGEITIDSSTAGV